MFSSAVLSHCILNCHLSTVSFVSTVAMTTTTFCIVFFTNQTEFNQKQIDFNNNKIWREGGGGGRVFRKIRWFLHYHFLCSSPSTQKEILQYPTPFSNNWPSVICVIDSIVIQIIFIRWFRMLTLHFCDFICSLQISLWHFMETPIQKE